LTWTDDQRGERAFELGSDDQRSRFGKDRDRIHYTSAFQRLAGITQIVRAGEADFFHTRQQHSLKVAQVGRRLAQHCLKNQREAAALHGVDPEVVEAAALAHDMGHPPFGHIGEYALNDLCREFGDLEGYEGNAQSFRIVTKLAVRFDEPGLDLTRATLAALLKYPWLHVAGDPKKGKKWSVYKSEQNDFEFARAFHPHEEQTAEAALMDWADDIAYSVHDLEDCHRCGLIPWRKIFDPKNETALVSRFLSKWYNPPPGAAGVLRTSLRSFGVLFQNVFPAMISEPYDGSRAHRQELRTLTSNLIGRYIRATRLAEHDRGAPLVKTVHAEAEIVILKQLTRDYIIDTPSLAAQQVGQRRIIEGLFRAIIDGSARGSYPDFTPIRLRYLWDLSGGSEARFAADFIASLTEGQATALYSRLFGTAAGSVLDPIVR